MTVCDLCHTVYTVFCRCKWLLFSVFFSRVITELIHYPNYPN